MVASFSEAVTIVSRSATLRRRSGRNERLSLLESWKYDRTRERRLVALPT